MIYARIMFWNTLGSSITPSFALKLGTDSGADIVCIAEPSGAFARFTTPNFEKVTLAGRRALHVFHNEALEATRTWTATIGKSGEAGCVKFKDGDDELIVGFCHAQFTSGKSDGTDTENWMAEFEKWLKGIGADLYLGDTNTGKLGSVAPRHPRTANSAAILGDRATTDGGMPYDKGKVLRPRVNVEIAGLILPARLRPPPGDGDMDDDKDAKGNFYIEMKSSDDTMYRQSNHRPIYVDVQAEGAA